MRVRLLWIAALLFCAACGTGHPVASPSALESPAPLSALIKVPDSTPVILYHNPANFDQIDGITWDGAISGKVGAGAALGGMPNSAGTLYVTGTNYVTGYEVHDRTGVVVAHVAGFERWADDQTHYCTVDPFSANPPNSGETGVLRVGTLNEKPRDVTRIGTIYPRTLNGGGPALAACSLRSDRAIVSQSGGQGTGTRQYWAVQLTTGRVLWSHTPSSSSLGGVEVVASSDGLYVAENQGNQSGSVSTVYGPTGAVVGHVSGWISAFSSDDSLAVVGASWTGPVNLIRLSDQSTLWKGPDGIGYGYWQGVAEPGGTRIALGLRDPAFPQTTGFAPVDLYVLSASGQVLLEKRNVYLFTA
jgi:hypothetical protein